MLRRETVHLDDALPCHEAAGRLGPMMATSEIRLEISLGTKCREQN